ncbi:hypothetical protein HY839_03015 [Candidatus Azambacteria bacterium]|nr:hypothetical protein [Candidatus Azambacteria bacterium]
MNTIFALVGNSRSGKSTLMKEVVRLIPERVGIIKSFTTRTKRTNEKDDDVFYDFLSLAEFEEKKKNNEFAECIEHAGNYYGYECATIDAVLAHEHGICAVVEYALADLVSAGYSVAPIKITPLHSESIRDAFYAKHTERENADAERAQIPVRFATEIINSFEPGGKEKAARDLIAFIENYDK